MGDLRIPVQDIFFWGWGVLLFPSQWFCVSQAVMQGVYKLGDLINFQLGPACIQ